MKKGKKGGQQKAKDMGKKHKTSYRDFARQSWHNKPKWDKDAVRTMENALAEKEWQERNKNEQQTTPLPCQPTPATVSQPLQETVQDDLPVYVETPRGRRAISAKGPYQAAESADTDITELLESIRVLRKYLAGAPEEAKRLRQLISDCNCETTDLLHAIELEEEEEQEMIRLYRNIKDMRKRRRSYKQRLGYMEELMYFITRMQWLPESLKNLQEKLETLKDKENNSFYAPRIRTDLKENDKIKYFTEEQAEALLKNTEEE